MESFRTSPKELVAKWDNHYFEFRKKVADAYSLKSQLDKLATDHPDHMTKALELSNKLAELGSKNFNDLYAALRILKQKALDKGKR